MGGANSVGRGLRLLGKQRPHTKGRHSPNILLTNRDALEGRKITKELGVIAGTSVQACSFLHDMFSRLVGFFGGEVAAYGEALNHAHFNATRRLQKEAIRRGADAVVRVSFSAHATSDPTSGVFFYASCYGTAVALEKKEEKEEEKLVEEEELLESLPIKESGKWNDPVDVLGEIGAKGKEKRKGKENVNEVKDGEENKKKDEKDENKK